MKQTISGFLLAMCLIASCSFDYEMKETNEHVPDKIVINAFLSPEENIRTLFGVVNRQDGGYVYSAVNGVKVRLAEDDRILYDGICEDTVLTVDCLPKAKSKYRIEASLDGYAPASAETTVPEAVTCKLKYRWKGAGYYNSIMICRLYDFSNDGKSNQSAIYISYYNREKADTLKEINSLYSKDLLIDNLNRVGGMPVLDEEVGSLYFENFMRIKKTAIPLIDTLVFAPEYGYGQGIVRMLTASDAYDTYTRTFCEQVMNIAYDGFSGAFTRLVHVYGNVSDGLGIFAGYNATYYYIENNETEE
jgi:hypothetical protein